jgi:hypothetical protein
MSTYYIWLTATGKTFVIAVLGSLSEVGHLRALEKKELLKLWGHVKPTVSKPIPVYISCISWVDYPYTAS